MAGKFECTVSRAGKHRFNLKASNGQVILTSQGYSDRGGCTNGIQSVRKHSAKDANFEKKVASDSKPYFVLKASNGQIIGTSQRYSSAASRNNGIESVKRHAKDAKQVEA